MGAVFFSLDPQLARILRDCLGTRVFVETGTYRGDTTNLARELFDEVITIELSGLLCSEAAARFAPHTNVKVIEGDSATALRGLRGNLADEGVLYFLDAHWCQGTGTSVEASQCALLRELAAIEQLNPFSAILIDDARLFLSPPPAPHDVTHWPAFHEVLHSLISLSSIHKILILNDVILFIPQSALSSVHEFARQKGVDWLGIFQAAARVEQLEDCRRAQNALIQELGDKIKLFVARAATDGAARLRVEFLEKELEEKEAMIKELAAACEERLELIKRLSVKM